MSSMLEMARRVLRGDALPPPGDRLIGWKMTHVEPGLAVFELIADARYANPMGTLHGGILAGLADSAMGMAFAATLAEGESFATVELKINFLKPTWAGRLHANARLLKRGRNIGLLTCDVVDHEGHLVAHAVETCLALRGDDARGR